MEATAKPRRALAPGALSLTLSDYHVSDTTDSEDAVSKDSRAKVSAAAALPTEVIQQILHLVDPETFASLVLLNSAWRKAADDPQIYAYHLAKCPSFSTTHGTLSAPFKYEDLPQFKRYLVQEAKRNLFAAFLRPQQTVLNLISTTTSSSAAFPNGEGYEFIFSHRARYCLALSSSRIIVLDTASPVVTVLRELKVVRRPVSAWILEDGSMLAVLAANHRVNVYDVTPDKVEFKRSIELDETAHTITMTTHGEILAAGCEGGVEVVSLAEHGPQAAKRVIKCDRIDNLAFSDDGTMLLGTTHQSRSPSTVILSAPYFTEFSEHEMSQTELLSHLWTSQIIFPNGSRDCSHAALLPRKQDQDANWTLTYDRVFESFRAVRSDDLRNGTTYFTGPEPRQQRARQRSKSSLTPKTLPAITPQGDLVAAAFLSSEIWLYGVPDDLERSSGSQSQLHPRTSSYGVSPSPSTASSPRSSRRELERLPRWQVLVDKYRNAFAKGRKVANVSGASNMYWYVPDSKEGTNPVIKERLMITAPGGVSDRSELDLDQEDYTCVDGGRLVILDFAWSSRSGKKHEITIEVGEVEPQLLEEEDVDMDTEIAVVRRRTLARREGVTRSTVSSVAGVLRPAALDDAPPMPPPPVGFGLDAVGGEGAASSAEPGPADDDEHGVSLEEAIAGLDAPYSQTDPRSRGTVYRSAEAVEANRRRNPPHPASNQPVQYRRTDGTELPHESDADNWTPPPPAYGKHVEDDTLPEEMRRLMMPLDYQTSSYSATAGSGRPTSSRTPQAANTPLRHSYVPTETPRGGDPRRRSSADIESSRWFSRHQDNRSTSPALNDDASRIQGYSPSPSSPIEGRGSPIHRPISAYDARASLYRAALQPPTTISPIAEPDHRRPSPAISARSGQSGRASREFLAAAVSAASSSRLGAHLETPSEFTPSRPLSSRNTEPTEYLQPEPSTDLRRNRTTPASIAHHQGQSSIPRRPVQAAAEPSAYQLNQMSLATDSREEPFGVGTQISSTSPAPQRRLVPRIKSFHKLTAALGGSDRRSTATAVPTSAFSSDNSSDNGTAEPSSRRAHRKSRRTRADSDALLSQPLEQAPLHQPLNAGGPLSRLSAAVAAGSSRPGSSSASGEPSRTSLRPSSRLSQRLFRRARPKTEDPTALALAAKEAAAREAAASGPPREARTGEVVEVPRMRAPRIRAPARADAQTQSLVEVAEADRRAGGGRAAWERSPFRGGGNNGEGEVVAQAAAAKPEDGDRAAIERAFREAYGSLDGEGGAQRKERGRARPRAKTTGEHDRKGTKCVVM